MQGKEDFKEKKVTGPENRMAVDTGGGSGHWGGNEGSKPSEGVKDTNLPL